MEKGSMVFNSSDESMYVGIGGTMLKQMSEDESGNVSVTGAVVSKGKVLTELSTKPHDPVGKSQGVVWLRSGTPNTLMFTDNQGIDHELQGTPTALFENSEDVFIETTEVNSLSTRRRVPRPPKADLSDRTVDVLSPGPNSPKECEILSLDTEITIINDSTFFTKNIKTKDVPVYILPNGQNKQLKKITNIGGVIKISTSDSSFLMKQNSDDIQLVFSTEVPSKTGHGKWIVISGLNGLFPRYNSTITLTPREGGIAASGVAISGDGNTVVIGQEEYRDNIGRVVIFSNFEGVWTETGSLLSRHTGGASNQGFSVGINYDGTVLAVGGPNDNGDKGAIWIYELDKKGIWLETNKISPPESGHFGISLDINSRGDIIVVSQPLASNGDYTGSVYIYERIKTSNWVLRFTAHGEEPNLFFGQGVAINGSGDVIAIGEPGDGESIGSVYVYHVKNISTGDVVLTTHISPDDIEPGTEFGTSVSLSDDGRRLIVSAPKSPNKSIYLFEIGNQRAAEALQFLDINTTSTMYGEPVRMSGNGHTFAVSDRMGKCVYSYQFNKDRWYNGENYTESDAINDVAISADGSRIAISVHGVGLVIKGA